MKRLFGFVCGSALILAAGGAAAQPALPFPPPAYALPQTESWTLAAADGTVYRIFVSLPKGEPPAAGNPILYVLDGNAMFAGFAEARRLQEFAGDLGRPALGKSIVVGIGYDIDDFPFSARRLYDFTPALPAKVPPEQARIAKYPSGGRAAFAAFILDRLRPEIARRYRVDPRRQALYGHSLGGLFALYMLHSHPSAFQAIVAASPGLGWNNQSILPEARDFAERLKAGRIERPVSRLLLLVGELETREAEDTAAFARRLEPLSGYGLRSRFVLLDGEDHASVPHRSITTTLRFAFGSP